MVTFPNGKINIGLQVLNKRADGYHNIQTIFYPLPLYDVLEIIVAPGEEKEITFSSLGLAIDALPSENICIKAYHLFKKNFPALPPVRMHLHKLIPMGAGLGGGSADAVCVLQLLNKKFSANLSANEIKTLASELGSDCVFFTQHEPCIGEGRGEILTPIKLDLSVYHLLLVYPGIHIKTATAFAAIKPAKNQGDLKKIIQLPIQEWKGLIKNNFEETVFPHHPALAAIKNSFYNAGALYASMSGSGSSLYGIFEKGAKPLFNFPSQYFYKWM